MPDKKIQKILLDIQPPAPKSKMTENLNPKNAGIKKQPKIIPIALGIIILVSIINILQFGNTISKSVAFINSEIAGIKSAVSEFNTKELTSSLKSTNEKIKNIQSKAQNYGFLALSAMIGKIAPVFSEISPAINNAALLSEKTLAIAQDVDYLKNNGVQLITGQKGNEFISLLEKIKNNIAEIESIHSEIKYQSFQLRGLSPKLALISNVLEKNYIPVSANLYRANDFLNSFLSILKSPGNQHFLLIFQNPSEMRPTGGFIGSYGDIALNQGNLEDLRVDDIYNADRQMPLKLIPPAELQQITKDWGARDANWFFDFPTSAKKIISLFEESKLHSENSIKFHGVIALNTNILGTIIDVIGPIKLGDYNLIIDSKNFLEEIQYEVEAGRDKKPGQNPKKILSTLTPIIFEKMNNLDDNQQKDLISRFKDHLEKKDVMVYFKDWNLQNFMETLGISGSVFNPPEDFSGDYLAIINTNIAGGKTDAFIAQHAILKSKISADGKITNEISISRNHSGQNEKDWWYYVANRDYLKILVPKKSKLITAEGNDAPPPIKKYNYDNYSRDIDLASIEGTSAFIKKFNIWTGKEFNKSSFGAWLTTPAGKTKELKISYQSGSQLKISDNMNYKFIYDKQSGVTESLEYSITAPPGYIWKESGKEIFEYGTQQPKTRETINLTLLKKKAS